MPLTNVLINGRYYSWQSLEFVAQGQIFTGITSINYKAGFKKGAVKGSNRVLKIGRTAGILEPAGDFTMYRPQFELFKAALGGVGFAEQTFLATVKYFEPELGLVVDTLVGAQIDDIDSSNADGIDASVIKCGMDLMDILFNGFSAALPRI